jgi:hypothetical protein
MALNFKPFISTERGNASAISAQPIFSAWGSMLIELRAKQLIRTYHKHHILGLYLNQPRAKSTKSPLQKKRRERARLARTEPVIPIHRAKGSLRSHFGAWESGDAHSADNARIDQDLAHSYNGANKA